MTTFKRVLRAICLGIDFGLTWPIRLIIVIVAQLYYTIVAIAVKDPVYLGFVPKTFIRAFKTNGTLIENGFDDAVDEFTVVLDQTEEHLEKGL